MSRTYNSLRNTKYALIGQILGLLVSFFARIIFIRILGKEYLGINGLFTNILTMLSLVELGIGPAIVFSLYKPLAENDTKKIKALMQLYKKSYIIIGIIIAILGILITPFLDYLIKDKPDVSNLNLIFLMFVANTSISYFFAYKRNLIIADQHRYIATIYRYGFFVVLNVFQIIFLYLTKNYFVFLFIQIANTFLENVAVSKHADKMYPYLKEKSQEKLDSETVDQIKKNTAAMVLHKIGTIVVSSTDNIIISAKVGITWVGLYSNYYLIINALNTIITQFFTAITASIGNLGVTESKEKSEYIFECINFIGFWIYGFCTIALYQLFNPFIEIWLGKDLLMSMDVIAILAFNFFITGMRKSVLTFRDAFGLFWYDRYKPIFESVINLVVSLILAKPLGITGVFIGTAVSTLTTCLWVEPYVLYKYGFDTCSISYFLRYIYYTFIMIIAAIPTNLLCNLLPGSGLTAFILKLFICLIIPNIIFLLVFYKTKEYKYLFSMVKNYILRNNKISTTQN